MKYSKVLCIAVVIGVVFVITTAFLATSQPSDKPVSALDIAMDIIQKERVRLYIKRQTALQEALAVYFQKAIDDGDIVGAGVSVVEGDSIVISDGFGKRSVEERTLVDGETVFRLGSLSKGFGGILAASLQAEGKLNFDDKIVDYLPEFKFGDATHTQSIKLEHIFSHTSGTPYHSFTNLVEEGIEMATIATRFKQVSPVSKPGKQYSYQNAMFALSQDVMQKATGKDVKTLLLTTFFKPLGMSQVSMDHKDLLAMDNVAFPHRRSGNGWNRLPLTDKYYNAVLAGGINASSTDMGKWMRFVLGHNPDVLNPKTIHQVFHPFITFENKYKYYQRWEGHEKSSYGFGWRIHEFKKSDTDATEIVWHHGGSVNNYRNEIALYPESDLGICILLNGNSRLAKTVIPDVHKIVREVFDLHPLDAAEKGGSSYQKQIVEIGLR